MKRSSVIENLIVAGIGGILLTAAVITIQDGVTPSLVGWSFVGGVFIVSASVLVGRFIARAVG